MGSSYTPVSAATFIPHPIPLGASVIWEGDSITNNFGVTVPQGYPALVYADPLFASRSPVSSTVKALDGSTVATMTARYAAQVFPLRPAVTGVSKAFLSIFIGTNDYTAAAATTMAALEAYYATAKADGFTIIGWTIPISFRPGNTPALNRLILKSTTPEYIMDAAAFWNTEIDPTILFDQLHPSIKGHIILSRMFVDQMLSRTRQPPTMPPNGIARFSQFLLESPVEVGNVDAVFSAGTGSTSGLALRSGIKYWLPGTIDTNNDLTFLNYDGASFVTPLSIKRSTGGVGILNSTGVVKTTVKLVANLLAPATAGNGARDGVTDSTVTLTAGIGAIVAGGGANNVPVYCDGTNWRIG